MGGALGAVVAAVSKVFPVVKEVLNTIAAAKEANRSRKETMDEVKSKLEGSSLSTEQKNAARE